MINRKQPIAVTGMAGIFPGAPHIDMFWSNIVTGISAICDVPDHRWVMHPDSTVSPKVSPDKTLSKKAGLIDSFHFDPSEFTIDADLLSLLDPMYHLVLESGKNALSGISLTPEIKKRCGVILAAIALPTDSASLLAREVLGKTYEASIFGSSSFSRIAHLSKAQCLAGRVTSLPAAIIARAFGLGGGTYTLDAACSSSLYAMKLACDELWSGRSDMMLAGGVSRPESLFTQAGFTQLKALSPSGVCAPFDAKADGLVVGEGAGVLVLKRLSDALRDHDAIHGLIHGSGLSNDIGGNLLAPDSEGQVRAMRMAYQNTGWSPNDMDHIECHGTGTPVGDTIELKSLQKIFGESGTNGSPCAIGSIKSMIGHLLTGAGMAGAIKTFLALKNKTLPPSLNFQEPAPDSPLVNGPFQVQTRAEDWRLKNGHPRRAAISAFGFGGINAHVLVEEWNPNQSKTYSVSEDLIPEKPCDVAVVGMGTFFDQARNLEAFQEKIFHANHLTGSKAPATRFHGSEAAAEFHMNGEQVPFGNYLTELSITVGEFHIPPNEIPDILPQHLMMLKAAAQAMDDAGVPRRNEKPEMGTAIGMRFDDEASNFHLRWNMDNQVRQWQQIHGLKLDPKREAPWRTELKQSVHPPLTASRTTGALGGIIASRVAKEFRLGGPSFIVSCEDASGLKALEIGVRSIQNSETDLYLVGAVDLPGEIRNLITTHHVRALSNKDRITPFDPASPGTLPGEGAVAVVLKRLDKARADGDRIYAVIKGAGSASGGGIDDNVPSEKTYLASLEQACDDARLSPSDITLMETHGSGYAPEDRVEAKALNLFFVKHKPSTVITVGATSPVFGQTGSASGLTSFIKACLCVYQNRVSALGPVPGGVFQNPVFHIPSQLGECPVSNACVGSMTPDGNVCHVLIQAPDMSETRSLELKPLKQRSPVALPEQAHTLSVMVGGKPLQAPTPPVITPEPEPLVYEYETNATIHALYGENPVSGLVMETIRQFKDNVAQTAHAHARYIDLSQTLARSFAQTLNLQSELVAQVVESGHAEEVARLRIHDPFVCSSDSVDVAVPEEVYLPEPVAQAISVPKPVIETARLEPAFPRDMCMEFAIGSVGKVLGPVFDVVDTYKVRVRLPDEPLMLVDRILSVEGEKGSLKSGKVVTEHDVLPGAWYLDGDRCPVCISIEAGQADLFLCSYLGIDLAVKGKRSYRLLDAVAEFHGGLPKPGQTVRYEIEIDRFINQGETYLFFFHFNGFIADKHIISMRNGCAGFFTEKEVKESGGIILTPEEMAYIPGKKTETWNDLVPFFGRGESYSLTDAQVDALREGDAESAFGSDFAGKRISPSLSIPGGRMKLVHRVLSIDPSGGRYKMGTIKAQADIHPDDWFLTCHFVDDMVMPGTLMYECCMHTLRIFTMRMGWITDQPHVICEPVPNVKSILKCRGPVTVETKHVFYVVDIKEIGYKPEPFIIADAYMYDDDDERIVMFRDMSMKLTGISQSEIEKYWG